MELTKLIQKRYKTIFYSILVFLVISLIITFSQPLKYRVQTKILVVQEFSENTDAYSASRMNEYLSGLFAQIISSESFFNQTIEAGFGIDQNYFTGSKKKQLKLWNQTVNAKALYDSGIITLNVYHADKEQALQIARSATYTLKTTNDFYHSVPNVDVRIIDSPATSLFPVKPNIPLNILVSIFFGFIVGILYAYQKEQQGIISRIKSKLF